MSDTLLNGIQIVVLLFTLVFSDSAGAIVFIALFIVV